MKAELQFLEKLNGLKELANAQGQKITVEEVNAYFAEDGLTQEQLSLVFDYLLAQKIVVQGYLKMESDTQKEERQLSEEDMRYLKEYTEDLKAFREEVEGEREALYRAVIAGEDVAKVRLTELYLKEVVEIAKSMKRKEVFVGDLVQEGNLGLLTALETIQNVEDAHEHLMTGVRQGMQMFLEESLELKSQDEKMVQKVTELDASIDTLTKDLGRKVSLEELCVYTGMEEEELMDILKLLGEEVEEEE